MTSSHAPQGATCLSRRNLLKDAAAAAGGVAMPFVRTRAAKRTLTVATYGGYFENNFVAHLYPDFEKATGIAVEAVSEPGDGSIS